MAFLPSLFRFGALATARFDFGSTITTLRSARSKLKQLQHRTACPRKQELWNEAHNHCYQGCDGCGHIQPGFALGDWFAIFHVHGNDNAQIIIGLNKGIQYTNNGQACESAVNDRSEEIELAHQTNRRRKPDQGKHEDRHRRCKGRMFFREARIISNLQPLHL